MSGMSRMNGKRELAKDLPTAEQLKAELARRKSRVGFMRMLYSTAASLIVVAALAVIISMLFLPVLRVTGTSMTPTLANDELVVCKRRGDFKQGDIVAFYYNNKILLKRVIAVSGDTVDIKDDGTVYVNGKKLDEPYVKDKAFGECNISLPYQVPDQRIFVMGDHRSTSIDSRSSAIGCVSEEAVVGKVVMRIMPLKINSTSSYIAFTLDFGSETAKSITIYVKEPNNSGQLFVRSGSLSSTVATVYNLGNGSWKETKNSLWPTVTGSTKIYRRATHRSQRPWWKG